MNKYQKEKSREIRDIMRSDRWGRMTYKEAKRKWRKGIRAFRIGDMYAWKAADLSHIGFTRKQLKEVGQAFYKILKYCSERGLTFTCQHEPYYDSYLMKFSGRSADGKRYAVYQGIGGDTLCLYRGSIMDIVDRLLDRVNRELQEFHFPPALKPCSQIQSMYPKMILHEWDTRNPEDVFGGLTVRG